MTSFRSNINGGANTLNLDTTHEGVTPIKFTHSNNYASTETYGSGSVCIETTGVTNNQPVLIVQKDNSTITLTNSKNIVIKNNASAAAAGSIFEADVEFTANNSNINAYNGKSILTQYSGQSAGTANLRDGFLQIGTRNSADTSYLSMYRFLPFTSVGQGIFETSGNGISISPVSDLSVDSKIELINAFQNTTITNQATASTKTAIIENSGSGASYIRSRSTASTASMIIQSDTGNNSVLDLKSNWVSGSGGRPYVNYYNVNDDTGIRAGIDIFGGYSVERVVTGTATTTFRISNANTGLAVFTRTDDQAKGWVRFGNGTGTGGAAGGIFAYDNNTTIASFAGSLSVTSGDVYPTTNNTRDVGTPTNQWARMHSLAYLTISDRNKKENIESLSAGLDFLNEVNTYKYKVKESNKNSLGVIAQEIEELGEKYGIPEGVIYYKQDGNYSVSYQEFIPILINAVKELSQQVKDLKNNQTVKTTRVRKTK